MYDLKGAARPAREHYVDPNYISEPEPENLMEKYKGNMWGHEGRLLLLFPGVVCGVWCCISGPDAMLCQRASSCVS